MQGKLREIDLQECLGRVGLATLTVLPDVLSLVVLAECGCGDRITGAGSKAWGEDARKDSESGEETAVEVAGDEGAVEVDRDRGGPLVHADLEAMVGAGPRC